MQIPSRKILVSARSLSKDFKRPNGVTYSAIENIQLDVFDNEFITILGLSGSGKSTLMKTMAGLKKADRGYVTYPTPSQNYEQYTSFVFQNPSLFPWLDVRENIGIAVQHLSSQERSERVTKVLDALGLRGYEDCHPRDLSTGLRQRVNICRGLVSEPAVLFMDEPFSQLDKLTAQSLREEIERLWLKDDRRTRSIVMASNDVSEAMHLSDRIIILSDNPGRIHKIIEIPLGHPRDENSIQYLELERLVERIFGRLNLDKITSEVVDASHQNILFPSISAQQQVRTDKIRPLINTSLLLVEGLISLLSDHYGEMDFYDLCEEMGQSIDQMLPAVASAELLGFTTTPGIKIVLTDLGKKFAATPDPNDRQGMFRNSCLQLKLVAQLYETIVSAGEDGLEKESAVEQIVSLLPFEDPETQFKAFLEWTRHADLIRFEDTNDRLYAG